MREIFDHKDTTSASKALFVMAVDDDSPTNLSHHYEIGPFNGKANPAAVDALSGDQEKLAIFFQNGPIKDAGVNGVTEAALLAVVMDRLRSHQAGPWPCRENALAITKIEEALMWIGARTADRVKRGVEGKNEK